MVTTNPTKLTRRTFGVLAAMAGATALAACSRDTSAEAPASEAADFDSWIEEAKAQKALTVYSGFPDSLQKALDTSFQDAYGITVTSTRLIQSNFAQRITAEQQAGQHISDVVLGSNTPAYDSWRTSGWLMKIQEASLPALSDWPGGAWNGYWADVQPYVYGVVYNTNLISESQAPRTWDDLLRPEFKGRTLMLDPKTGVTSAIPYQFLLEHKGDDYLRSLRQQGDLIDSITPGIQAVGAGAASLFVPSVPAVYASAKASKLPVQVVYPSPSTGLAYHAAALESAPHAAAARVYINHLLTAEAQELINDGGFTLNRATTKATQLPSDMVAPDWSATEENLAKIESIFNQ